MKVRAFIATISWVLLSLTCGSSWADEKVRAFDIGSWQQLIGSHKGQPLIVHFWGLTCGNCMVELKDWGKFAREHPGTAIVLVNWDRNTPKSARVAAALTKAGLAGVESFALFDGYEEKLRFAVDRKWMGELPYTRLIGSDSSVSVFSGSADFRNLAKWVAKEKR